MGLTYEHLKKVWAAEESKEVQVLLFALQSHDDLLFPVGEEQIARIIRQPHCD